MSDESKKVEATVSEAAAQHMVPPCPHGFHYTVKSGDTMYLIARRFGITLDELIAANPQVKDPNLIYPGQVLCIPKKMPVPCPGGFYYTVQPGDSMYSIAQKFNVSLDALIAANPQVQDPNLIYPGQVLCIPVKPIMPCPNGFIYVVKPGDTLSSIARKFGTTVDQILAANPQITDPNLIYPGQRICIPIMPPVMPRRHCFMMHPTHHCPGAMGMGMIDIEKRELLVVARGIPDPRHFDMDHVVLMVRYREMEEFKVVEMMPMAHGMMMGHHMMDADMDKDPVLLIGAARRFPFVFGPLFLGIVVPIII
ncbi:Spore coat assembly protein SafA [Moorella glycerini]|uniref:Muramidase-2 n=1 Tax=Neomoorella stamsii TaxID=1266720 RepID=A0A9X7J2V6_9FIRM|nr:MULTISPECIES: LysM peptidoglycan-binding domain-containing protein [Moorella]PRR72974.1 Muramidase-2 precursor [Moorella stamsii]CEP67645.1 Spore coat assembly protein SafA [Moorella glycerini]